MDVNSRSSGLLAMPRTEIGVYGKRNVSKPTRFTLTTGTSVQASGIGRFYLPSAIAVDESLDPSTNHYCTLIPTSHACSPVLQPWQSQRCEYPRQFWSLRYLHVLVIVQTYCFHQQVALDFQQVPSERGPRVSRGLGNVTHLQMRRYLSLSGFSFASAFY